nr:MAG TPA: hypothetical protein [Microviridae sp.]
MTNSKKPAKIESRRGTGKLLKTSSECQIGGWQRNRIDRNNSKPK